ncbi:30S ribosome-binding factor RbfA [Haliangium ochraceum]|uniref:Ribosome-binding factor A n=1 Tax=Haliangium ochraceum (strain DSM 14365 / JCM 11303 / SMP-2) TaxID=502025 RepID=D0LZ88_HALO1|nr:30S ribosome-binding factor RbfA [Haliangium ochraceum]ACY16350.1 ribosome-binding factor A [Haliangium ochraceum DSM 14365]
MAQGNRRQRVGNALREVLTELVARELKDPRVHAAGLVSINQVELNRDLSVAFIYVSFVGAPDARAEKRALDGLQAAAGFLRGPAARRLKLQRAPELRFMDDPRGAFAEQMRSLVRDDEVRAAAAQRDDEDEHDDAAESRQGDDSGERDPV